MQIEIRMYRCIDSDIIRTDEQKGRLFLATNVTAFDF